MEATEEQKARWSNPYPPYDKTDFKALAERDEEFAVLFNSYGGALNWQDFEVVKAVTKSMLKVDFGLDISIPDDRLCPPVPNRWNYVHWIQSLIDSTNPDFSESYDPNREVIGLDIGTGASAIYAMLMLRTRPNWTMCATDVDKKSMDSAAANLASNSLLSRTKILQTIPENSLIPIKAFNVDKLDFTMCNPPWYSSEFEMKAALKGEGKRLPPNAICTGSQTEMVYPEGDLGFATKIYEESLELKEKVTWYSCLFGKYTSMISFVQRLKNENATSNFAVTSLLGGSQTKRWAVAWSFGSIRPAKNLSRPGDLAKVVPLPFPSEHEIPLTRAQDLENIASTIDKALSSLDLHWKYDHTQRTGLGSSVKNVWNRAYLRSKQRKKQQEISLKTDTGSKDEETDLEGVPALTFKIRMLDDKVLVRWMQGVDTVLWESFCGYLDRATRDAANAG